MSIIDRGDARTNRQFHQVAVDRCRRDRQRRRAALLLRPLRAWRAPQQLVDHRQSPRRFPPAIAELAIPIDDLKSQSGLAEPQVARASPPKAPPDKATIWPELCANSSTIGRRPQGTFRVGPALTPSPSHRRCSRRRADIRATLQSKVARSEPLASRHRLTVTRVVRSTATAAQASNIRTCPAANMLRRQSVPKPAPATPMALLLASELA